MKTLQDTNTAIWKEWLPANEKYELAGKYNLEWYSPEGMPGADQKCQIWIPVSKREFYASDVVHDAQTTAGTLSLPSARSGA